MIYFNNSFDNKIDTKHLLYQTKLNWIAHLFSLRISKFWNTGSTDTQTKPRGFDFLSTVPTSKTSLNLISSNPTRMHRKWGGQPWSLRSIKEDTHVLISYLERKLELNWLTRQVNIKNLWNFKINCLFSPPSTVVSDISEANSLWFWEFELNNFEFSGGELNHWIWRWRTLPRSPF